MVALNPVEEAIRSMSSCDEFDGLASRIPGEAAHKVIQQFAALHRRRRQIRSGQSDVTGAQRDFWSETLLMRCAVPDRDGFCLAATRNSGDTSEFFCRLPMNAFKYYAECASDDRWPPAVRALYCQALWEFRSLNSDAAGQFLKPIDALRSAIRLHIEAAHLLTPRDVDPLAKGLFVASHWRTAVRLALETNQAEILAADFSSLREQRGQILGDAPAWALSLVKCEISVATYGSRHGVDLIGKADLENALEALAHIDNAFRRSSASLHFRMELLVVRAETEWLLGRAPPSQELALREAETLIDFAGQQSSAIVSALYFKQAAQAFARGGERAKARDAKNRSRESMARAAQSEVHTTVVSLLTNNRNIQVLIAPFFSNASVPTEVLRRIRQKFLVPSLDSPDPDRKARHRSLASQIFVTVPVVGDRIQSALAPGTPEQEAFEGRQELVREIELASSLCVSPIFQCLRNEMGLQAEDLAAVLSDCPFVNDEDLPFLRTAVARYMDGDLISAIHVLTPRVENVVRCYLNEAGVDTTAVQDGRMRERALGDLIRAGREAGVLSTSLALFLEAILGGEGWGMNLRNNVAHGLLTPRDCRQAVADRLFHVVLVVSALRLPDDEK